MYWRSIVIISDNQDPSRKTQSRQSPSLNQSSDWNDILFELSLGFAGVTLENLHDLAKEALAIVGEHCGADRLSIYSYDYDHEIAIATSEWCADGVLPQPAHMNSLHMNRIASIVDCHKDGEAVYLSSSVGFNSRTGEISIFSIKQDVKSMALFPLNAKGQCLGFLGLDHLQKDLNLTSEQIFLLKVLAGMYAASELRCRDERSKLYLQMHDCLTGLYNRTYFEEEIKRLRNSRNYPISLLYVDINGLKAVNDAYGHEKGDELLKAAAKVLQRSLRGSEVLSRIGGDEFAALLVNTGEPVAQKIVGRIKKNVRLHNLENRELPLSLSLGLATAGSSAMPLEDLLRTADDLMYRDKMFQGRADQLNSGRHIYSNGVITGGYSRRLDRLCQDLGAMLGLALQQANDLALLVKAHNMGKAGISRKILYKQGKLSPEEQNIICLHPEKGYRIALSSAELSGVADLILKHHEWWNGQGYPLGLKEEEIPIECRILAVVDAFTAMTDGRSYKNACSCDEALAEIQSCAGSQFDPHVVEAFCALYMDTRWLDTSEQGGST